MSKRKSASQSDIAEALGVSISTVSRALIDSPSISEEIRRNVRDYALRIGYPIKAKQNSQGFKKIFVFNSIENFCNANSSSYQALLNGVLDEASKSGALVETVMTRSRTPLAKEICEQLNTNTGAIFVGLSPEPSTLNCFSERGIISVLADSLQDELKLDSIMPADFVGGSIIAKHLIAMGHRQFLYFDDSNPKSAQKRLAGFRAQLEKDADARLLSVFSLDTREQEESKFDQFLNWFDQHRSKATTIFCFNDSTAIWAIEALQSAGVKVPVDISIAGFDELPISTMTSPELTTYQFNWNAIGVEAVKLLHSRLNTPLSAFKVVQIGGQLISRASVLNYHQYSSSNPKNTTKLITP